jgi:hypothetical protein
MCCREELLATALAEFVLACPDAEPHCRPESDVVSLNDLIAALPADLPDLHIETDRW